MELQRCRFFILEQESACFSALIVTSVWKDKIDWLKMESKCDASETHILEMKSREPKTDLGQSARGGVGENLKDKNGE